mgnify:CR=1 FL=1
MNHWNTSPIGQTNEAAPRYTPKEEDNSNSDDTKPKGVDYKYLLANEDLQKIRRSNHSSHHPMREVMDDEQYGDGLGNNNGYSDGTGDGEGCGSGNGNGYGDGYGIGYGNGYGYGSAAGRINNNQRR